MRGFVAMPGAAMLVAPMLVPGAAHAQDWRDRQPVSVRVDASALDLSTGAGVDELERRVKRAVDRICGGDRDCREEAWASADDQVRYAIARDEWTRRLADERAAQLAACGGYGCPAPQPAYYAPPPPPPAYYAAGGVTVTIIHAAPSATVVIYPAPPPPPPPVYGWR
jgi:UrcA family protein